MGIKKRNTIITIIILLIVFLNNQTKGQTIKIKSLDGKNQTINVVHDSDWDILTITTLKDTLHIEGCNAVEQANSLNEYFIKIIYQVRGGSGIRLRHMMILTSKNNILYQSLHITSLFNEQLIDYSKSPASSTPDRSSLYEVKIKSLDNGHNNQKMIVIIHNAEKSKDHPRNDYDKESNVTLSFDKIKNMFYSNYAEVSQYFLFYDPKTRQESKQYLMGRVPLIKLGKYHYYYIRGEWYEISGNSNLSRYSYK